MPALIESFNLFSDTALTLPVTVISFVSQVSTDQIDQVFYFGSPNTTRQVVNANTGAILFSIRDQNTNVGIDIANIVVGRSQFDLADSTIQTLPLGEIILGGVNNKVEIHIRKHADNFAGVDEDITWSIDSLAESLI